MTDPQIIRDIDSWSRQRLRQWGVDCVDRYEIMDVDTRQAEVYVMSIMMVELARLLVYLEIQPDEAAAKFGEVMRHAHGQARRAQR